MWNKLTKGMWPSPPPKKKKKQAPIKAPTGQFLATQLVFRKCIWNSQINLSLYLLVKIVTCFDSLIKYKKK